ncbi:MAG TPA: A/G-specific adenine glycosylase [Vicinamibacteria bacterium]|nr:A/G-specific adenine glycosylase [Vicinamibacteria bacterium]
MASPAWLQRRLLEWYRRHRRDLPWRRSRDPYRVWVSEVMLQQTTVKAVVPYYERFLARFPTLASLAAASEHDVLASWSGLGYYHRARNLRRGARHVLDHHQGSFPATLEAALAVPGVGLYTASAVLSIARDVPLPVVDGNVRRVLARLFALRGPEWRKDAAFYNRAEELLERKAPGEWNQAVMELGATVCLPRRPACPACPLRGPCQAVALGIQDELPEGRARRAAVDVTVAAALVERDGRVLLVRRGEGRLMGRMWEVPQTSLESRGLRDLARELRERHGLELTPGPLVARGRHAITFRRIRLEAYRARLRQEPPPDAQRFLWATPEEIAALPVSSLTRKVLRGLASPQMPLAY